MGIRVRDGAVSAGQQTLRLRVRPAVDPRRRVAASVGLFSAAVVGGLIGFGLADETGGQQPSVPQAGSVDPGLGTLFEPEPGQVRQQPPEQRAQQPDRVRSAQPVEPQAVRRQLVAQREPRPAAAPAPHTAAPRPAAQPRSSADPQTREVQQAWRMAGDLMEGRLDPSAMAQQYSGTRYYYGTGSGDYDGGDYGYPG